ncbi:Interferon alpha/beta receptor 2 [Lonchura striata]|uniref:Interferon alpha/beta receptor 2 n=1 Tax=Lonchura striata TaxID=40157 RepID=A0A218UI06_9PASE|nr:interferon alpha/beta receptor 2 [Lonchura striata domestica]OWK53022.1 Interferon alpha/beta receptor 2 [Lonchura striata domestica]
MRTPMDVPVPLCQLVCLTFLSTAVCSLPERILEGLPYNLQMDSHNFQHILSWQAEHDPAVPASYNVLYRDHRSQSWMSAQQCSGIAQLSCELTEEFKDISPEYSVLVQSIGGAQVLNSSVLRFVPLIETILGPPEVNITSCLSCINVTIKLPASHFRAKGKLLSLIDIYEELDYDITLKSEDGELKRPRQTTTEEVFSTVIEELYPSRNYCASVGVTASLNRNFVPSPLKCVTTDSEARQGYHEVPVAVAVGVSLIIAAVLKCVHSAGFIFPEFTLPQTLAYIKKLAYSPWVSESEALASVEIIPREVKSKARRCRGSDSSDSDSSDSDSSDSDSSAPCDHDYTRRDRLGRGSVPQRCDTPSSPRQYSESSTCEHSSSQAGDTPAAEPQQLQEHPGGDGDTSSQLLSPLSGDSGEPQSGSGCFTISLHTVLLGTLEQDGHGSAAAAPAQQDAEGWHCAHALQEKLLEDTGSGQGAPCSNDFPEWQKSSSSSEESDSSDSDTEQVTGYMRR